jgi:hypothetical protein
LLSIEQSLMFALENGKVEEGEEHTAEATTVGEGEDI